MKRKLSLLLTIIIAITLVIPLQSFAAGMDQGLENAIKIAKSMFAIPDNYKFEATMGTENGKNVFSLNWRGSDDNQGYINVRINEEGTILGYDRYKPSDYEQTTKLPKFSRKDARTQADAFIRKVNPAILSQVECDENYQNNLMDTMYYFGYYRVVNGIPYYNDRLNVSINRKTGEVQSYYMSWTDDLVFPAPANQITPEQAKAAYEKNLGLRMIYKYAYNGDKVRIYAVYTPRYDNETFAVDAFTGEKIQVGYGYYGPYYGGMYDQAKKSMVRNAETAQVTLNPDELKAVEDAAKLKTVDEAEKIARAAAFLELTSDYKLDNYNLNAIWPVRNEYMWYLNFNKPAKDDGNPADYIGVSVNANTGMIMSFYRNSEYQEGTKAVYKREDSKAAIDAFIKEYYPELYSQMEYDQDYSDNYVRGMGTLLPRSYGFRYNRLVNGIAFPDNGITVDYDAVTGKITNFNLNWFNLEFPAIDKAITSDTAYGKLFSGIGLTLQYKAAVPDAKLYKPEILPSQIKSEIKLVYSLKPGKPLFLDADTGAMLDYDGNPYKEVKPVNYTDISGNYAEEQIMVLAENGVYLEGTEFKPNTGITQKDFFILLSKTLNYYGPVINSSSSSKDIEDMYAFLEREGVIKTGEKAPDGAVTRQDAVKFIIRALKYDKVADIKGIYNCSFKDRDKIDPALAGYVAIAAGLGIVGGYNGSFDPGSNLTRAAAAIMIYNYLQI